MNKTTQLAGTFHVVPFGDWWAVVTDGPTIVSVHDVKLDAIHAGNARSRQSGSELVIHNRGSAPRFETSSQSA